VRNQVLRQDLEVRGAALEARDEDQYRIRGQSGAVRPKTGVTRVVETEGAAELDEQLVVGDSDAGASRSVRRLCLALEVDRETGYAVQVVGRGDETVTVGIGGVDAMGRGPASGTLEVGVVDALRRQPDVARAEGQIVLAARQAWNVVGTPARRLRFQLVHRVDAFLT
jgi:hypothetical protein